MPKENLIGQKFNHWTIIDYAKEKSSQTKRTYWICQCDCEFQTIKAVRQDELKNGRSTRCTKCSHLMRAKNRIVDLLGEKFGRLTVLKQDTQRTNDGRIKWICQCECGNICSIAGESLRGNKTQSCGCLQKEAAIKTGQQKFEDLTNQVFGHLTALKFLRREGHHSIWLCQCDCEEHNLVEVYNDNLKNKHTQSCGKCKKSGSIGEKTIVNLLEQNGINFNREQRVKINNVFYRFDFYVNNQYMIEFDGIGHYQATGGWNTDKRVVETQQRDKIKNEWCKENRIPLIRIPYTHLKDLCIEDLSLETSKFVVSQ